MALALNKSSLKQQRDELEMYERFLPSLDLKRQQLIAEFQHARTVLAKTSDELTALIESQCGLFSLLGASELDLSGLVRLESVATKEQNLLGVRLPVVQHIEIHLAEYSMLAKPFWVDLVVELLRQVAELSIRQQVEAERVSRLNEAVRKITQRVNLFEKVLIPRSRTNIQRIRLFLSDAERVAVIRSKIAKAKQQQFGLGPETA